MNFRLLLTIMALVFSIQGVFAQSITVTGSVVGEDGLSIIGATVVEKGTTNGTTTDFDGNFQIKVDKTGTLVFSFMGLESKEEALNGRTNLNITLLPNMQQVDEVVVTALGIKKEKKALGYAFSDVSGEEMSVNRDANFINSISNKVAGVNISQTSGGAGTSSRIVIRGAKSISGNSQPLIVVDGVPQDNSSDGASWLGGLDYGNSLMDIAPDDIETMSVLKGPNAAALYGSRASNGVIVITTKKGSSKEKMKVTINSNTTFNKAYILGNYQNTYGAGYGGGIQKQALTPEQEAKHGVDSAYYYLSTGSWGPEMDGSLTILNWNDEMVQNDAQPDNVKDYFENGFTFTNSIAVENGNDQFNWRFSVMNLHDEGIKPNSEYDRTTISYTGSSKMGKKASLDFKASYIREDAFNRVGQGDSRTGARNFVWMPRSININTLKRDYKDANGFEQNWYTDDPWQTNPYWEAYENYNNDNKDRFTGFAKANADILPWMKGFARVSLDTYTSRRYTRVANNSLRANGDGQYNESWVKYKSINSDFFLMMDHEFSPDLSISGNFGGNMYQYIVDYNSTTIFGLAVPNFFSLNNQLNPDQTSVGTSYKEKRINSLYGSASINFKNYLFAELTARNDWSSSLPAPHSFFYPSINTSFVFSDAFEVDPRILSLGKIRFSYAYVGNDTDPYNLETTYDNTPYGSVPTVRIDPSGKNPSLKPESTASWELGTDLRFFQDRFSIDATYYNEKITDQILTAKVSKASGYDEILINGGEMTNKGIELLIEGSPIKTKNSELNLAFNFAKNVNEVVSLPDGIEQYTITEESQISVVARPGYAYGDIMGSSLVYHEGSGKPIVDETGLYIVGERKVIGNITPDWTGGLTTSYRYGGLSIAASLGFQVGGDIFSKTNKYGLDNGQYAETLEGRESWYNSTTEEQLVGLNASGQAIGYKPDAVLEDGTPLERGLDPQVFWHQHKWGGIAELDVYDASYVKLRDITVSYSFPKHLFENNFVEKMNLSVVGKNLWVIYSGIPNVDPEASFTSNNNGLGQEYASLPNTRQFGINFNITF